MWIIQIHAKDWPLTTHNSIEKDKCSKDEHSKNALQEVNKIDHWTSSLEAVTMSFHAEVNKRERERERERERRGEREKKKERERERGRISQIQSPVVSNNKVGNSK